MEFLSNQASLGKPAEATYVPLPFEQIMAVGQEKQKAYDIGDAEREKLQLLYNDLSARPEETGAAKAIVDKHMKNIEKLTQPGVDLGSSESARIIRDAKSAWLGDEGVKTVKHNKEAYDKMQELYLQDKLPGYVPPEWSNAISKPEDLFRLDTSKILHQKDLSKYINDVLGASKLKPVDEQYITSFMNNKYGATLGKDGNYYIPGTENRITLDEATIETQIEYMFNAAKKDFEAGDDKAKWLFHTNGYNEGAVKDYLKEQALMAEQHDIKQVAGGLGGKSRTGGGDDDDEKSYVDNKVSFVQTYGAGATYNGTASDLEGEIIVATDAFKNEKAKIQSSLDTFKQGFPEAYRDEWDSALLEPDEYGNINPPSIKEYLKKPGVSTAKASEMMDKYNIIVEQTQNLNIKNNNLKVLSDTKLALEEQAEAEQSLLLGRPVRFSDISSDLRNEADMAYIKSYLTDFRQSVLEVKDLPNTDKLSKFKYSRLQPWETSFSKFTDDEIKEMYTELKEYQKIPNKTSGLPITDWDKTARENRSKVLKEKDTTGLYTKYYQLGEHLKDIAMVEGKATMLPFDGENSKQDKHLNVIKEMIRVKLGTASGIRSTLSNADLSEDQLGKLRTYVNTAGDKLSMTVDYRIDPYNPGKYVLDVLLGGGSSELPSFVVNQGGENEHVNSMFEIDDDGSVTNYIASKYGPDRPNIEEELRLSGLLHSGFNKNPVTSQLYEFRNGHKEDVLNVGKVPYSEKGLNYIVKWKNNKDFKVKINNDHDLYEHFQNFKLYNELESEGYDKFVKNHRPTQQGDIDYSISPNDKSIKEFLLNQMGYDENSITRIMQEPSNLGSPDEGRTAIPKESISISKNPAGRNNNPLNIKDDGFGNVIGKDKEDHAIFDTPEEGLQAGKEKLQYMYDGKSDTYPLRYTMKEFSEKFATSPNDLKNLIAAFKTVGYKITRDETLREVTKKVPINKFLEAMSLKEDFINYNWLKENKYFDSI